MSSQLVSGGFIGNCDASGWPLEMECSSLLGFPTLSGLANVAWRLRETLSWIAWGNMLILYVHSRHNSRME
jgi:hypothetical protein